MEKEQFLSTLREKVRRDGVEDLVSYLEKSDFFTAPASSKFHSSYAGGLADHSYNVYLRLVKIAGEEAEKGKAPAYSEDTLALCGLMHDLCKANTYKIDYRNAKEDGVWVKKPFYAIDEKFPFGHGEKSVYLLQNFIKLTAEEALAIDWHMGGFDQRVKGGSFAVSSVYEKSPLAAMLHAADLLATYLDEERGESL